MLSLNGVSAWIEVDGKELEQYGVEEDPDQRTVTCWIPTQVGKGFSVVFKDDLEYRGHSLSSRLQIDGSIIPGWILSPSAGKRTLYQSDQTLSATTSRPFLFSKLELTDQDEHSNQASPHLGEIRSCIHRVQVLEGPRLFEPKPGVPGHGKIHERSKKAVTQCVSYGLEVKTESRYTCATRYLDGEGTPLVTFVFKYRDLDFLQAAGIIPRPPPTKKRSFASGDVLDLTTGADVKSESDDQEIKIIDAVFPPGRSNVSRDSDTRPAKRIKREKKFVPALAGEVIDLT